jgi:Domain of unknown function (DUF892)
VDTPVAVGWQLGDDRLDLRHEFIVWQRWPADPSPGAKRTDFRLHKPQGKTCDAIMGIIEEGQEIMKEYKGSPALDAGLVAAAQAVEHYEISRYCTICTWAEELGLSDAVKLLEAT